MGDKRIRAAAWAVAAAILTSVPIVRAGSQEQMLYTFTGGGDGAVSWANLVSDPAGNLYGTTIAGGAYGYGTVFQLAPSGGGTWTETVLHSFNPNGLDGVEPEAGLVRDAAGNLYGTTYFGGAYTAGTVFEVAPQPDGTWSETVLYSFNNVNEGRPAAGLTLDQAGNLYGTSSGVPYWCGTVFELTPQAGGAWKETVLHNFGRIKAAPNAGCQPTAALVFDSVGNLYGTTSTGGASIYFGTVFRLGRGATGQWTLAVLHSFSGSNGDGEYPYAGVAMDSTGRLYGTSFAGGNSPCFSGCGIVFKLAPAASGQWKETILHSFTGGGDGGEPYAGVTFDAVGNLYGATTFGGNPVCSSGCGVVFELTPNAKGRWIETVLHSFDDNDGRAPDGSLILDSAGTLFGTTLNGGEIDSSCPSGCGLVFALTPALSR